MTSAGDGVNRYRRYLEQRADQAWAVARRKLRLRVRRVPFDGEPRFAFLTVNRNTTFYLKLLLLTLSEQRHLDFIERAVIVDNHSSDGGAPFLRALVARCARVHLAEVRHGLHHARGMRRGLRVLDAVERSLPHDRQSNLLLFLDTDVVFRSPDTLFDLAAVITQNDAGFAGEFRQLYKYPDAQASFFAVRRDVYDRRDVMPWVHHGAPAYWMQRSIWRAGFTAVDFPSNHGGYVLHRGRTAVAATHDYTPRSSYATATRREPHYMGVANGAAIWAEVEARHRHLLEPANEPELLDVLSERFTRLGVR